MRECGECSLCCKLLGIEELNKPSGKWCDNVNLGKGCMVYGARPLSCRTFACGWLANETFGDHWRPMRCKMVVCLNVNPSGRVLQVYTDASNPNGFEKEPFRTEIMNLARNSGLKVEIVRLHDKGHSRTPAAICGHTSRHDTAT